MLTYVVAPSLLSELKFATLDLSLKIQRFVVIGERHRAGQHREEQTAEAPDVDFVRVRSFAAQDFRRDVLLKGERWNN